MKIIPSLQKTRRLAFLTLALFGYTHSISATPIVFNASESAAPGDVIYLQGDNFVAGSVNPTVWFHRITGTETTLAPDVQLPGSALASVTNKAITVNLPVKIPMGLYAVWIKDSENSLSQPVFINQARATSFEFTEVSPGYTFRIFGRNLCLPGVTPGVKFVNGSTSLAATLVTTYPNDPYILQVKAPSGLVAGTTYTVTVSNGYGHNATANFDVMPAEKTILGRTGGTDSFALGVPWGADFATIAANKIDVTLPPYNADKTGAVNALVPIQQAIAAAKVAPNGGTVYLPAGTYLINKGTATTAFDIPAKVVLQGAGIGQTILNDISSGSPINSYLILLSGSNSGLSGATGFTCNQNMVLTEALPYPPMIRNAAIGSSKMFFDKIKVNGGHWAGSTGTGVSCGKFLPQSELNTKVLVQNCDISYVRVGSNATPKGGNGSEYIIRNNNFPSFYARVDFLAINNLLMEGNHFTRDGTFPPAATYSGTPTLGGLEATGADNKILNNIFDGINLPLAEQNDGESILCQATVPFGGPTGSLYQGTVVSATSTTLTDTSMAWGVNSQVNKIAWITSGPGAGSWAVVTTNTADTLTLDRSWATIPTSASQYEVDPATSYHMGTTTGATSTTLTDTVSSWPTNFYNNLSVAIVDGSGTGQVRKIVGNTLNTLTVNPAWDQVPTSNSKYSINGTLLYGPQRWLVKGNTLKDVPRGIIYYMGAYDCVTVGNRLASAGGIFQAGGQRNLNGRARYDRFDMAWNNLFADNVVSNPDAAASRAAYYSTKGMIGVSSPLFGTLILGAEFRRNILQSSTPNLQDNSFGCNESFDNIITAHDSDGATGVDGMLDTIYSDNVSISSTNAYRFTTGSAQATLWNSLLINCTNLYSDAVLTGATQASKLTTYGGDPSFLGANFRGTGTSTGGSSDLVDMGATATLTVGTGTNSIAVSSASPFTATSGSYITVTNGTTGTAATVQMTPTTARTSWGRIFDGRMVAAPTNGKWLVNGAFDFFWRPLQTPSIGSMRPIDLNNLGTGSGIRLALYNASGTSVKLAVNTGTGGGGLSLTGTYAAGFVANQIYHVGVVFTTDVSGVTTAKIFMAAGTNAIITSGTGADTPIATGTFTLNPSVVTDTTGFLSNSAWAFGDWYSNGALRQNDYDCLRLYSVDPVMFPACN